ncbi:MAG: hypothetical protein ACFFAH_00135 [Promethearchaeota archaeon]
MNFLQYNLIQYKKWKKARKEYDHLENLLKDVKRDSLLNKKIVFNTVRSMKNIFDREFFIGKILALNGANIVMLLDDGIMKHWDTIRIAHISNINILEKYPLNLFPSFHNNYSTLLKSYFNKKLIKKAIKTYKDTNLKIIYYSEILKNLNYENWQEMRKYAESSTIRFFQTTNLDFNEKYVDYYYKLSLINSIISKNVGEYVLNKIKPDFFLTSHGIYSSWGPAYDYLKKNNVKSYVYAGYLSHSIDKNDIYFTDAKVQTLSRSTFWKNYKNTPVTKEMEEKIKDWINLRMSYSTKDTKIYYNGELYTFKVDKNDGYKYHIAIFPSLVWDGNIKDRHIAFNGILDWLISTINYLKKRRDIKIFLKFHPAEVTQFKNTPKIQDILLDYIKLNKIENLVLIPSENIINPYEFIKSGIDFGICYDGTLALEMPLLKIPILLGGVGGRFYVEGGNFTIKSREEYFNYLDNLENLIEEFHNNYDKYYTNIIRYSYWYLFENVMKLPTLSSNNLNKTDLLQLKKEDIKLDKKLLDIFKRI